KTAGEGGKGTFFSFPPDAHSGRLRTAEIAPHRTTCAPYPMPDPVRLLATLRRAIDSTRATPGRSGRLVTLTAVQDVLVGGDLHGHIGNFQVLMQKADLKNQPNRHLVFQEVVHSPYRYPLGGDKSHQLLDLYAALQCQFPG